MSGFGFGPFDRLFGAGHKDLPAYLRLLHCRDPDVQTAIDWIEEALALCQEDRKKWITALLCEGNWRPHLVGILAILLAPDEELSSYLWQAIDQGSWVMPQLSICALLCDQHFAREAKNRLTKGCPVLAPKFDTALRRHVEYGPTGMTSRSGKMAASLLALCEMLPSMTPWVAEFHGSELCRELLALDVDNSEEIVKKWLGSVQRLFAARGRELKVVK